LPAVDVGRSVSRVGGKTQLSAYREVAGDLRLSYSQFEELEAFSRFGTRMDEDTRQTLERGRRVREILKQRQYRPLTVPEQIAALVAVNEGVLDDVAVEDIGEAEKSIRRAVKEEQAELCKKIAGGEKLAREDIDTLKQTAQAVLQDQGIVEPRSE
jgi:F-type H+-transporting ATPase subunit alpha